MEVHLRGICEATAAHDRISVNVPAHVTATAVAAAVCETLDSRPGSRPLRATLFHDDGRLRATTRVLDTTGRPLAGSAPVTGPTVKLAAVLPCDG